MSNPTPYPTYSDYPKDERYNNPYGGQQQTGAAYQPMGGQVGPEAEGGFNDSANFKFTDTKIRHAFVRKVYSILVAQLTINVSLIALFLFVEPVSFWFKQNGWMHWVLIAFTFILVIVLACCDGVRRTYPANMILLGAFTIAESLLVASITAHYDTDTVLIAVGITTVVVLGITLFSLQTKYDFTGSGIYLFVALLILMVFGFLAIIIRSKIMHIIYAAAGAGIFSMYLVFDTQLMLGGKHKYSISPEEYIMAALNLYLDIINLFLMILRLVGFARD